MSGHGKDITAAGRELIWPTGHTTAELEAAELEPWERDTLADLLRMRDLATVYRTRLRGMGLSWLGIPTAEQTPRRMARVLVLLMRRKPTPAGVNPAGFTVPVECSWEDCPERPAPHMHVATVRLE